MAMVRVSGVLLGIGMLMLAGCSFGHGPTVANTLDVNLDVIVRFADGEIKNIPFKPGMAMGIGKGDGDSKYPWEDSKHPWIDGDPRTPIPIEEVVIKEAGQLLHQFNAEDVRLIIEKQESDWGYWCIDREKVYLAQSPNPYPDAREHCSKGKRLWTWQNGRFYKGSRESP